MRHLLLGLTLTAAIVASGADVDANAVNAAAAKAVDFLTKQQNENGSFGKGKEAPLPGLVALVVEALAHSPGKPREANNPALAKAVKYLMSTQQADGSFALQGFGLENYNTSVAAIAIKALENPAYAGNLDKAKAFILSAQTGGDESNPRFGSFGYGPGKAGDLSNTSFSMEALKELGLEENSPAWQNAVKFIKRCQDNAETNDLPAMKNGNSSGGFVYIPGESPFGTESSRKENVRYVPRPYGNMTYEAVKSLIYAKVKADDPSMQAALKWIKANYAVKEHPGAVGNEGYYYYVLAFTKAFKAAGMKEVEVADGRKVNWAKDMAAHLITLQKPDGSFVNTEQRWMEGNPILATSYALQALNVCAEAMK